METIKGSIDKCARIASELSEILDLEGLNNGEKLAVLGIFSGMVYSETAFNHAEELKCATS